MNTINGFLERGGRLLIRINLLLFIVVFLIADFIKSYILIGLYLLFTGDFYSTYINTPSFSWKRAFYVCLVFPIAETLFFQVFLITLVRYVAKNTFWSIILSALLFGLSHYTNVYYQTTMFLSGLLYGLAFTSAELRTSSTWKAFAIVTTIHVSHNLIVNIINAI